MVFDLRRYSGEVKIESNKRALIFKIERQPLGGRFAPGRYIVYLLVKRDRNAWRAWLPFAFVDPVYGALVWKSKSGRYFGEMAMLLNDPHIGQARGYTYHYEN